jgi:hypothetical protein
VTQDIDVVLPADKVDEFKKLATVSGFEVRAEPAGRWPKLRHRETSIQVEMLPEGRSPGVATKPAPTTIPHPSTMGATRGKLSYASLAALIELKLAAGRLRDDADVLELARENCDRLVYVRNHLAAVHPPYAMRFEELLDELVESTGG